MRVETYDVKTKKQKVREDTMTHPKPKTQTQKIMVKLDDMARLIEYAKKRGWIQ